jgi:hypothetical protein
MHTGLPAEESSPSALLDQDELVHRLLCLGPQSLKHAHTDCVH